MALRINQQGSIFLVEGTINSSTVKQFKNHLEFLMLYKNILTINLDGVDTIDNTGVNTLRALYSKSLTLNKKFSIIGNEYQEICDDFQFNIHV